MPGVTRTFQVAAPPRAVVAYLANLSHAEQWDPATVRCIRVGVGPIQTGARWFRESKIGHVRLGLTYTLEELSETRVAFTGRRGGVVSIEAIDISPSGAGSTVSYENRIDLEGAARLAVPLAKPLLGRAGVDRERRMASILNSLPR